MKIKKIICVLLSVMLLLEGSQRLICDRAKAQINYTGYYYKHTKDKEYEQEYSIYMKKKSAYKGKIHLSKQSTYLRGDGDTRVVCDIDMTIYKVGKNSYEGKKGKASIKVKVYKNKIVIKQKGYTEGMYTDMVGTYKRLKNK